MFEASQTIAIIAGNKLLKGVPPDIVDVKDLKKNKIVFDVDMTKVNPDTSKGTQPSSFKDKLVGSLP